MDEASNRYRDVAGDPRALRPRAANKTAALLLLAGLVAVILAIALFG